MSTPPTPSIENTIGLLQDLQRREDQMQNFRQIVQMRVGSEMRAHRMQAGLSLRKLATRIKCSAPFLSDMELGRRRYTIEWIRKANKAFTPRPTTP